MFFGKNKKRTTDMSKEKAYNETVGDDAESRLNDGAAAAGDLSDDNMTDREAAQTDKTADAAAEPEPEETEKPDYEREIAEWKDKYVRLHAEFDNYRKRTLREKMELVETGGREVLKAVLPVMDDVQRAVAAMGKSDDIEALRRGVELIAQKFAETLRQRKVTEIEAKGKPFDEEYMEAVAKFAAGEEQKGKVIDVVQTGYMLGERVLRFAKVVVGE